jgi:hypothetical protein
MDFLNMQFFQPPVISFLLDPNILPSTLFTESTNLCLGLGLLKVNFPTRSAISTANEMLTCTLFLLSN